MSIRLAAPRFLRKRLSASQVLRLQREAANDNRLRNAEADAAIRRALEPTMSPPEDNWTTDRESRSLEVIGDHVADIMFFVAFDADDGGNSDTFADFTAEAIVQALPVTQARQMFVLDGSAMVGSAWGKIENGLDQISAVLLRDDLNRDLAIE